MYSKSLGCHQRDATCEGPELTVTHASRYMRHKESGPLHAWPQHGKRKPRCWACVGHFPAPLLKCISAATRGAKQILDPAPVQLAGKPQAQNLPDDFLVCSSHSYLKVLARKRFGLPQEHPHHQRPGCPAGVLPELPWVLLLNGYDVRSREYSDLLHALALRGYLVAAPDYRRFWPSNPAASGPRASPFQDLPCIR